MFYDTADPKNIVVVEGFVSKEHTSRALSYCESVVDWSPLSSCGTDKISPATTMKKNDPELHDVMCGYLDRVKTLIEYKFGRRLEPAFPGLRRWDVGDRQDPHADGETFDGIPTETYADDYGSIIYLNDNFSGGEISFPAYDLTIKPSEGMLIFFPSSTFYVHEVLPITAGVRYTSAHFWVPIKHKILMQLAASGDKNYEHIPHAHTENLWD